MCISATKIFSRAKVFGGFTKMLPFIFLTADQVVRLLGFEVLFLPSQKGKEKKKNNGKNSLKEGTLIAIKVPVIYKGKSDFQS